MILSFCVFIFFFRFCRNFYPAIVFVGILPCYYNIGNFTLRL
nr:MAG TPA: hypothetical protein [Caudoviricetes sp.]